MTSVLNTFEMFSPVVIITAVLSSSQLVLWGAVALKAPSKGDSALSQRSSDLRRKTRKPVPLAWWLPLRFKEAPIILLFTNSEVHGFSEGALSLMPRSELTLPDTALRSHCAVYSLPTSFRPHSV